MNFILPNVAKIPEKVLEKMNTKRLLSVYRAIKDHMYSCICDCGCNEVKHGYEDHYKELKIEASFVKSMLDKRENVEK